MSVTYIVILACLYASLQDQPTSFVVFGIGMNLLSSTIIICDSIFQTLLSHNKTTPYCEAHKANQPHNAYMSLCQIYEKMDVQS